MNKPDQTDKSYSYLRKVLIFVLIVSFIILMMLFIGQVILVLILLFAGILFGILLRVLRDLVHDKTGLSHGFSLVMVIILFCTITIGGVYLLAPAVYKQAHTFYQEIPQKWETVKSSIAEYGWGQELAQENPHFRDIFEDETNNVGEDHDMTQFIVGLIASSTSIFAGLLLIFVTGIYMAAEPQLYANGLLRLFPKKRRKQVVDIMEEISISIQWWLVGQLIAMIFIGTLTTVGLYLMGMPYPLLFGLFAALTNFIPNLGPIIAAIPAILIALTESIELAIYVAILFTIIQGIEGNFITPLIYRKVVNVPPVLIIATQFILFYLIGFLGVLVAMPLLVCMLVIVKKAYIEDLLGDSLDEDTAQQTRAKSIFDKK